MNETNWTTNEVASAYERNFTLLEAARKEYSQVVVAFLTNLHHNLVVFGDRAPSCEGVKAIYSFSGSEFNAAISVGLSVTGESAEPPTPSDITISARAAAPTGGNPDHLRVTVAASLNDRNTSWNIEKLSAEVRNFVQHADNQPATPAAGELLAVEVPLRGDGMSRATNAIQHLCSLLAPIAMKIVEEMRFTERMKQNLIQCALTLTEYPPAKDGKIEKIAWWQGMHYIQFNTQDAPGFWVGYLLQGDCLMYGHNQAKELPSSLPDDYFRRVNATPPKTHANFPSGVLLASPDLRLKSSEEIANTVVRAFHEFHQLITELRAENKSQSSSTLP